MNAKVNWQSERVHRWQVPTAILGLDLSLDETVAYVATFSGVGRLKLDSGEFESLYAHDSYASGVFHLSDANLLVSSGYDGQLRWFDLEKRETIKNECCR